MDAAAEKPSVGSTAAPSSTTDEFLDGRLDFVVKGAREIKGADMGGSFVHHRVEMPGCFELSQEDS